MAKGRVEADVADEAARQCWGARELLLRWGFPNEQITLQLGHKADGAEGRKPIAERQLYAVVELVEPRDAAKFAKYGVGRFVIECGPCPSRELFALSVQRRMASIAGGVFSEEQLAAAWRATDAYLGRVEIMAELAKRGFAMNADAELPGSEPTPGALN